MGDKNQEGIFEAVSSRVNFPEMEEAILNFWSETDILSRISEAREGSPIFTLYEGPPTANGTPGIHHVLARVFKDVIPRYKTMKGYLSIRKGGWDTHGLPVELEIEKELGISTKGEIESYGIEKFNALCRESVMRYVKEWEQLTSRIGFLVDMSDAYVTFTNEYIETCWWILKELWDDGLMYMGMKGAPHCPRCVTTLSSHEVALGYKENTPDPSVFVKFRIVSEWTSDRPKPAKYESLVSDKVPTSLLAWTTTPWTLPANTALAVSAAADYSIVEFERDGSIERLIVASALEHILEEENKKIVATIKGSDLDGMAYELLYDPVQYGSEIRRFSRDGADGDISSLQPSDTVDQKVFTAEFVSLDDGTGIVHIAPAFGDDDLNAGRLNHLAYIQTVNLQGEVTGNYPFSGKFVKDADEEIMQDLDKRGLLYKRAIYKHTYPFCWRCDSPLLYYAKSSWYIRTTAKQENLISGNEKINWYPDHIKSGRFGEWLRNNIDWALSRERYWGTPLPVWQCENCNSFECFASVKDLKSAAVGEAKETLDIETFDLHRPYIDSVKVSCKKCEGTMNRVPDVLDAWFDSGAMPYSQHHIGSKDDLQDLRDADLFPADYICEAIDQTRGWFYTLHALGTLVAGEPSYKNVICLGHILDNKGEKMSKSKGNVVQPWDVINDHGADAIRWYMYTAAPPGNSRRFSADLVSESVRRFMLKLWNVYSFFVTYANLDGYNPAKISIEDPTEDFDRWIRSELEQLTFEVTRLMDEYNPTDAGRRIQDFIEVLSNWYVRRSRRRFWKSENDDDKASAYSTLYECLVRLSRLLAPFTPFVAEEMYRNLVASVDPNAPDSVHLSDFPVANEALINKSLSDGMRLAIRVSSMGRAARSKAKVRIRQPLARLLVRVRSSEEAELLDVVSPHIMDELNIKEILVMENEGQVANFQIKPNLQLLGPKFGADLPAISKLITSCDTYEVSRKVLNNQKITLGKFELDPSDLILEIVDLEGYASVMEANYIVAVDTTISSELADEGITREVVHIVQSMRRSAGFEISDRIVLWYQAEEKIQKVIKNHEQYIREETLSKDIVLGRSEDGSHVEEHTISGADIILGVKLAN